MARKKFEQISDDQIRAASIASLADKPNSPSNYGTGDLTAEQLKAKFDAFPKLVKEKISDIVSTLAKTEAGMYITLQDNKTGKDNLYDFIELFTDAFTAEEGEKQTIADFICLMFRGNSASLSSVIASILSDINSIGSTQDTMHGTLYNLESKVNTFSDKLQKGEDALTKTTAVEKRVTNLESQVNKDLIVTDSSVAYAKEVPARSAPYAEITKFGGMSYKSKNLISSYYDTDKTSNGIEWRVNADGTITANGTATSNSEFLIVNGTRDGGVKGKVLPLKANRSYALSGCPSGGSTTTYELIYSHAGGGANLVDYGSGSVVVQPGDCDAYYFCCRIYAGVTVSNLTFRPMLAESSVLLPYEQHYEGLRHAKPTAFKSVGANKESTLAIPSAVLEKCDGYGYGVYANAYNYVDWVAKKYHKVLKKDIISNVFKPANVYENIQYFGFAKPADFIGYGSASNAFSIGGIETRLTSGDWDNSAHIGTATGEASYSDMWVGFPAGTTLEEAKAALEGKEWIYVLKKEEVTDISNILPDDNLIPVEGGGSIIAENDYNYDIPSEITYQLRSAT